MLKYDICKTCDRAIEIFILLLLLLNHEYMKLSLFEMFFCFFQILIFCPNVVISGLYLFLKCFIFSFLFSI